VIQSIVQLLLQKTEELHSFQLASKQINLAFQQLKLDAFSSFTSCSSSSSTTPSSHQERILYVQIMIELLRIHMRSSQVTRSQLLSTLYNNTSAPFAPSDVSVSMEEEKKKKTSASLLEMTSALLGETDDIAETADTMTDTMTANDRNITNTIQTRSSSLLSLPESTQKEQEASTAPTTTTNNNNNNNNSREDLLLFSMEELQLILRGSLEEHKLRLLSHNTSINNTNNMTKEEQQKQFISSFF
jgi:hypothetical protein